MPLGSTPSTFTDYGTPRVRSSRRASTRSTPHRSWATLASQSQTDTPTARTWKGVTSDPQLVRAYFALVAGDAEAGDVDDALSVIKGTYRNLLRDQLLTLQSAGWTVRGDPDDSASALFALLRGYLLQLLEEGSGSGALEHGGLVQFKSFIALQIHPSAEVRQPL